LPLIKTWIAYMAIGAFAAGSQIFVEPELINRTTGGVTNQKWAPNQVAFGLAFRIGNFNYAAAERGTWWLRCQYPGCSSAFVARAKARFCDEHRPDNLTASRRIRSIER
jgi:multiple sugar transport system permease protein